VKKVHPYPEKKFTHNKDLSTEIKETREIASDLENLRKISRHMRDLPISDKDKIFLTMNFSEYALVYAKNEYYYQSNKQLIHNPTGYLRRIAESITKGRL